VTRLRASDAELLADSADPAESFAAFYRRHAEAVLRFVASRGADAETAADVVAETFCAVLKQRSRYRPHHDSARLWILGIAVRKLADARRREHRELRRVTRAAEHARVLTGADRASYAALVERSDALDVLADLPDTERQIILARVVQDHSYADIADALGLTEMATRKRVSRGLAHLRTRLERI
jgi:RNA polymerase sigma-70 factor (ECF subfamily)